MFADNEAYTVAMFANDDNEAYTGAEAAEDLSRSVVQMWGLMTAGEIPVKRRWRRVLVPAGAIKDFLDS